VLDAYRNAEPMGRFLGVPFKIPVGDHRVRQHADCGKLWYGFHQKLQAFGGEFGSVVADAGEIAARFWLRVNPVATGSPLTIRHDQNRIGRLVGSLSRWMRHRNDHVDREPHQFFRRRRQAIVVLACASTLEADGFVQLVSEFAGPANE
jgi:hypothetical protein